MFPSFYPQQMTKIPWDQGQNKLEGKCRSSTRQFHELISAKLEIYLTSIKGGVDFSHSARPKHSFHFLSSYGSVILLLFGPTESAQVLNLNRASRRSDLNVWRVPLRHRDLGSSVPVWR